MSAARNELCACHKSGAWRTKSAAEEALERVQALPPNPDDPRWYKPVDVQRCAAGIWHLTAKPGKSWRSGKKPRRKR